MLIGHSDGSAGTDIGHLKVTIHHNFFDGSRQRHPRVRFGEPVHVYNNYFRANELYGVASTMNAGVLVEGNYFENVPYPVLVGLRRQRSRARRPARQRLRGFGRPADGGQRRGAAHLLRLHPRQRRRRAAHRPCGRRRRQDLSGGQGPRPSGDSGVSVDPFPGQQDLEPGVARPDSTRMSPWCLLTTIRYEMSSPSPVPSPTGLVVKNGSKIRLCTSGGMPGPVSPISTTTCSSGPGGAHGQRAAPAHRAQRRCRSGWSTPG